MSLPTTGSISAAQINVELKRASGAPFSINGGPERALAGKPSGPISFADFRGKSLELVKFIPAGGTKIHLSDLFTAEEWTSTTAKRAILNAGAERGTASADAAVATFSSVRGGWGGSLTLEVNGTISGIGGPGAPKNNGASGATGGAGGTALNANGLGLSGQKLVVVLGPTGKLRGGGGGGGSGGVGGRPSGGAGGAGGRGEGFDGPRAEGSIGVFPPYGGGRGGTGGRGGLYGDPGTGGGPGSIGSEDYGFQGGAGGLAGFAIANPGNYTLVNNGGTILGRL